MADYEISDHARARMAERGVDPSWVDLVMSQPSRMWPDPSLPDRENRARRIPAFGNRVLRVVVTASEPHRVITAFFDRALINDPDL